jgi:hypothetical protein
VTVFLATVKPDGTPDINGIVAPYGSVRMEWDHIQVSGDAKSETRFQFEKPIMIPTNKSYALLVKYDGFEDFELWYSRAGDRLVGTNNVSPGVSNPHILNYYEYNSQFMSANPSNGPTSTGTPTGSSAEWKPLNNTDLKINIYAARYRDSSNTVANNTTTNTQVTNTSVTTNIQYFLTQRWNEYLCFPKSGITFANASHTFPKIGEYVFQNTSFHTGTINCAAGSLLITGNNVNFSTLYNATSEIPQYIIFKEGSTFNVRKIISIESNTTILIDKFPTITNTATQFYLPTPVATISSVQEDSQLARYRDNQIGTFFDLIDSNANATVRFLSNTVEAVTVGAGGTGYSNSDYIVVYSSDSNTAAANGYVNAAINVVTNSTGGIISTYINNVGSLVYNSHTFRVANSTGSNSTGSGASLTFTAGPTVIGELSTLHGVNADIKAFAAKADDVILGGTLQDLSAVDSQAFVISPITSFVNNIPIYNTSTPVVNRTQPMTTATTTSSSLLRTISGSKLLSWGATFSGITTPTGTTSQTTRRDSWLCSRSLTCLVPPQTVNSVVNSASNTGAMNDSVVLDVGCACNNDFTVPDISDAQIIYYTYQINNDYTGENTRYGNAVCKHISGKVTFDESRLAEDVLVFLRAYKPTDSNIKVFVKIHNSKDPDAFDDKDWTLLAEKTGGNTYSSLMSGNDYVEISYGFPLYPNTEYTANGTVLTTLNQSNVIGSSTNFDTEFAADDLIKVYSPLFPDNYVVHVVNTVTNATHMVLNDTFTNNGVIGTGMVIDKLAYNHQAFNNITTDNVVRYYNSSMVEFDGYNTVAVKMVLLTSNTDHIPRIDDIRLIGVSA